MATIICRNEKETVFIVRDCMRSPLDMGYILAVRNMIPCFDLHIWFNRIYRQEYTLIEWIGSHQAMQGRYRKAHEGRWPCPVDDIERCSCWLESGLSYIM